MRLSEIDVAALPILIALNRKPQTLADLSRTLQYNRQSVARWVNHLIDMGLIVRRWDKCLTPVVFLRIEHPPDVKQGQVVFPEQPGDIILSPTLDSQPKPVKTDATPLPKTAQVSNKAKQVATQFRVPAWIRNKGEAGVGRLGPCVVCQLTTPLMYGGKSLCPNCAGK